MDQAGIATLAVIVVLIAATVGTIGTPLIVDAVDVQPDSPLYSLERAGESIKGAFAGGQDWEIERAQERCSEFAYMVDIGNASEYTWLVEEANNHLFETAKLADDNEGLQKTIEANLRHLVLLENVKEKVPAKAKLTISFAQLQSYTSVGVLENVAKRIYLKIPEPLKVELDNRLSQIRVVIENMRIENIKPPEFTIRVRVDNIILENISPPLDIVIVEPPDRFENEAIENFWIENILPSIIIRIAPPENLGRENDMDGDGIPDWYEEDELGADPRHKDIFVEIDRMRGDTHWSPDWEKQKLIDAFKNAPIWNPDGTTGVNLHLVEDDVVPGLGDLNYEAFLGYVKEHKDYGPAYYYALLVDDFDEPLFTELRGKAFPWVPGFALDQEPGILGSIFGANEAGSVFMHELGHLLGLMPSDFEGIDSDKYPFSTYKSVMNYNAPTYYDYSRGPPFDDWEHLEDEGFNLPATFKKSPTAFGELKLTAFSDERKVLPHLPIFMENVEITIDSIEDLYFVNVGAAVTVGDMTTIFLGDVYAYFWGAHGIEKGDNLTGFGALYYEPDVYIDAFSDGFWIAKVVHAEENAWVWTDKNSYQMGETVTIYFKNLAEEPLIFGVMPTWHIERYEDGSWKLVRIYPPDLAWILLPTGIEPGEIKSSTWDQKIYIGSRENYEEIQAEPGRYRVVWRPENWETVEPVGEFKSEFKVANIIIYWPENFIAIGPATLNDSGATPQTVAEVVDGNNRFAFDLYSQLACEEGNVFFSPWSISTALAMTYEGARGQTAEEMESVLHLPENDDARRPSFAWIHNRLNENKEYELESANALWAQEDYPFFDSYFDIIQDYYGGNIANLDFKSKTEGARKTINDWVSEKTRGKIEELIEEGILNQSTRLVLTNAIYFKGEWVKQFNENATHPEDFWVGPGRTVEVPMMSLTGENAKFNCMETEELEALEMPYKGEDLSMLILLPKTRFGLSDLEESINPSRLNEIRRGLKEQKVNVCMPKFEFNTKYELSKTLEEMGMVSAFVWKSANFSGMDGTRDLFIQSVIHEAFVKVDEKGTEATAATGVSVGVGIAPPEKTFHADHPSMFIIQEKRTGNILFLGRVVNPSK